MKYQNLNSISLDCNIGAALLETVHIRESHTYIWRVWNCAYTSPIRFWVLPTCSPSTRAVHSVVYGTYSRHQACDVKLVVTQMWKQVKSSSWSSMGSGLWFLGLYILDIFLNFSSLEIWHAVYHFHNRYFNESWMSMLGMATWKFYVYMSVPFTRLWSPYEPGK